MAKIKDESKKITRSLEASGFYSDFDKEKCLYGVLIRSPAASGKIKSISVPQLPEGYFLYTQKDIPGKSKISINKTEIDIFGSDYVKYTGEPLGILCGPDEKTLFSLLEEVSINFDVESLETELNKVIKHQKRPLIHLSNANLKASPKEAPDISEFVSQINALPSLDTLKTISPDSKSSYDYKPQIVAHREIKSGIFNELSYEQAIAQLTEEKSLTISEETWTQELIPPLWKETSGTFCYTEGKKLHIYAPSRWYHCLMKTVSEVLNIPMENIYLHKTITSGIFSKGLWRTSVLAAQVALASFLSKHPVKLVLTQVEQNSYMAPGVNTKINYKAFVTSQGQIKALCTDIQVDTGICNPFAQEIIDRMAIAACNYYKPENLYITAKARTSKNPPTSICLKSIDSQVFFALESHIQKICDQTNLFPAEIRHANTKNTKGFPFSIPQEAALSTFENSLKISDFNRKYASFHMDAEDRLEKNSNPFFALPLRGIGIATAYNSSGYNGESSFSYASKVEVTLISGATAVIHTIKPSSEIQEIWKETAAEILEIPKDNITIDSKFDLADIPETPEDSYSTISSINELIKKCCNDIQKKRFHQPLPITSKKGLSTTTAKKLWNKESFTGTPFNHTSFATTVVEVELDSYTYNEKIKGIWVTIDCGEILDQSAVLRSVRLEIQQELAMLVDEKTVPYDNLHIEFINSNNKPGQISQLIHNTLPAAFASALSLALSTQVTKLPCSEAEIYEHIKERETQKEEKSPAEQKVDLKTEAKTETKVETKTESKPSTSEDSSTKSQATQGDKTE